MFMHESSSSIPKETAGLIYVLISTPETVETDSQLKCENEKFI